jgi:hypothetical protein
MNRMMIAAAAALSTTLVVARANGDASNPVSDAKPTETDHAQASADATPKASVSVEPIATMALGGLGDTTAGGIGALVGFEHQLVGNLVFTGHAGYISGFARSVEVAGITITTNLGEIPALAGVKVYASGQPSGFYFSAEGGPVFVMSSVSAAGQGSTSSGTYFGGMAAFGYRAGHFDGRVGIFTIDLTQATQTSAVFASLGYSFSAF